jgi:hypothetical protein
MYNFGVCNFWSFNIKFKVISRKVSPFVFKFKFQNPVRIWKSFQHETCRAWNYEDFIFWEFFKSLHDFGIISKLLFRVLVCWGGELQCSANQGSAASGMGAGEPPMSCWPSNALWMSAPISRAFLSRLRASLVSLYNPDATVRSLLCFLCFTADAVVFTCVRYK